MATASASVLSAWSMARQRLARRDLASTLARGSLWSLYMSVLGTALSFGNQIVLAHVLSVAEYGVYLYVLAGMNVALIFARLEFDVSAVRFLSALAGQGRWGLFRGFLRRSRQIVAASSLVIAAGAALVVWWLRPGMSPSLARGYWAACALLPVTAYLVLHGSYLQGLRRVPQAQAPGMVVRPLVLCLGVGVVILSGQSLGAAGALMVNVGATVVALLLTLWWLRRALPGEARAAAPAYDTRQWVTTSAGLLVMALAQIALAHQTDLIVVGSFVSKELAGLYGAASQISALVAFGTVAVMFAAAPVIADLHASGRQRDLQRLVVVVSRAALLVSLPVYLGILLLGRTALRLYGPSYEPAYVILVLLATSTFISAALGHLAGFLLTMTGHQNQALVVFVGSGLLNLTMTSWMTPTFGAEGAATASTIATTVKSLVLVWAVRRHLGIRVTPLAIGPVPSASGRGL